MIYVIVFLTAFVLFLLFENYTETTTWILAFKSLAIIISTFASIFFINKFDSYPFPQSLLLKPDYTLYLLLVGVLKLPYNHLLRLQNFGVVLYAMTTVMMGYELKRRSQPLKHGHRLLTASPLFFLLLLPLLFYMFFYDPVTIYRLHLRYHLSPTAESAAFFLRVLRAVNLATYLLMLTYFALPILMLARRYFMVTVSAIKRQILALLLGLLLLNGFSFFFFFFTSFQITNLNILAVPLFFTRPFRVDSNYFTIIPAVAFVLIVVVSVALSKYALIGGLGLFSGIAIRNHWNIFNRYLRGYLHSFKNILFTNKILAQKVARELGSGCETLTRMEKINDYHLLRITRALDSLKKVRIQPKKNLISEPIELVLRELDIPENIQIRKSIQNGPVYADFDAFHLHEAIFNILQNSVESILLSHREEGVIKVEVFTQFGWIVIQVTDNGLGLDNRLSKEIFNPFFSTKSKEHNFGIGLSYAYRIIMDHKGFIFAEGRKNEYAAFHILLPRARAVAGG